MPPGGWCEADLRAAIPDLARPYKEHFVVDLAQPGVESATLHHRRDARRGLRRVAVERSACDAPFTDRARWQADWRRLYAELDALWDVPGKVCYRASQGGATVAMQLWLLEGAVARYHLAAQGAVGCREGGASALTRTALHDLAAEGVAVAHLGAAVGASPAADDGLTRFKRGWATGTRGAWLCGRIGDRSRYEALARARGLDPAAPSWFPVYQRPDGA